MITIVSRETTSTSDVMDRLRAKGQPNGLVTSFHRTLQFKPEMVAQVEVVTQDHSALGRVLALLRGNLDR